MGAICDAHFYDYETQVDVILLADTFQVTVPLFIFLVGVLFLYGGIRIIAKKKTIVVDRYPSSPSWKSQILIGNKAIIIGIGYVIYGVIFMAVSLLILLFAL